jgi:hypothetical protein
MQIVFDTGDIFWQKSFELHGIPSLDPFAFLTEGSRRDF